MPVPPHPHPPLPHLHPYPHAHTQPFHIFTPQVRDSFLLLPAEGDSHGHVAATISPRELLSVRDLPATVPDPLNASQSDAIFDSGLRRSMRQGTVSNTTSSGKTSRAFSSESLQSRASIIRRVEHVVGPSQADGWLPGDMTATAWLSGTVEKLDMTASLFEQRLWDFTNTDYHNDEIMEEGREDLLVNDDTDSEGDGVDGEDAEEDDDGDTPRSMLRGMRRTVMRMSHVGRSSFVEKVEQDKEGDLGKQAA